MTALSTDPHAGARVLQAGAPLHQAGTAFILLHGRGASAEDILGLGQDLAVPSACLLAPQAAGHSWYPNSFLAPLSTNEPWLTSALEVLSRLIAKCEQSGVAADRIVIAGFSQGACLACEFAARHPRRYAALLSFTGGLLGPLGTDLHHPGSLDGTPILLSGGDPDLHVPWIRVEETAAQFTRMHAAVEARKYLARAHTIAPAEFEAAQAFLHSALRPASPLT